MKPIALMLILSISGATAEGQSRPSVPTLSKRRVRSLFGALLIDKGLQKELRMTRNQTKRMQEIYLQYANPASVVFSAWGIKNLDVTEDQLYQYRVRTLGNNQEKMQVLLDKSGKYKDGEKLKKVKEMDIAFSRKSLSILTRSQLRKFERLKGKPYKLRAPASRKRKPAGKPKAKPVPRR